MGYAIGYSNGRDIGYGVPAECDMPRCHKEIDRGMAYCCGEHRSDSGCGLYFCESHLRYRQPRGEDGSVSLCPRCYAYRAPYNPKPDLPRWLLWKLKHYSWAEWRKDNPAEVNEAYNTIEAMPAAKRKALYKELAAEGLYDGAD